MTTEERLLRLENAFATLAELAAKSNERHDSADDRLDKLLTLALSADERLSQQQAWINELGEAQARLAQAQAELSQAQARTEAAMAETNERLNNLINIVERFISEGRNGKS